MTYHRLNLDQATDDYKRIVGNAMSTFQKTQVAAPYLCGEPTTLDSQLATFLAVRHDNADLTDAIIYAASRSSGQRFAWSTAHALADVYMQAIKGKHLKSPKKTSCVTARKKREYLTIDPLAQSVGILLDSEIKPVTLTLLLDDTGYVLEAPIYQRALSTRIQLDTSSFEPLERYQEYLKTVETIFLDKLDGKQRLMDVDASSRLVISKPTE